MKSLFSHLLREVSVSVRVQTEDFNAGTEIARLTANDPTVGAVASFIGLVRAENAGQAVTGLTLEHYPGMTEKSLEAIEALARQRWPLGEVVIIHRVGPLNLGEQIVLVAVSSAHRQAAFAACEFMMDHLKTEAPFWKQEASSKGMAWVDARESDTQALARWREGKP